ncbi:3-phosphoshikimate 1-carboxyvinyltransferase [bacterium]|nr:3-phosphoshikimate 1-carboxyvinyltransferase [bacterium]
MDIKVNKNNNGFTGEIEIPSDKSITHRAIMLLSLAKGKSVINNFSKCADCFSTLKLFAQIGIEYEILNDTSLKIISSGKLKKSDKELYCGNSGTTMRLVSGILSGQNFDSILTGDESLSKRPMKRIIEPLSMMGANIESNNFKSPLKINGSHLCGINYVSNISSAQVKSCLLLAGLHADGETVYTEPYLSRNHSELMLKYLGADIETDNLTTKIKSSVIEPKNISVCGDISSAAFFIAAGLIVPNSRIIIKNVGLNYTRTGIIDVIRQMGGNIEILDKRIVSNEEVGDILVEYSQLKACEISGEIIPRLIDEIPIIAVLATQAEGTTIIKDAQDLRNKESDRIKAIVTELQKLGADIIEMEDGFTINGKCRLIGNCELQTYCDHRLAMSLYVAGLISKESVLIKDFHWVNISFPGFTRAFAGLSA